MAILLGAGTSRAEEAAYSTLNRLGNALMDGRLAVWIVVATVGIPMHRRITRNALVLIVVALLIAMIGRPVGGVRAAAPALTLGTDTIACDAPELTIAVSGSGFAPGATIALGLAFINQSGQPLQYTIADHATANADGAFVTALQLRGTIYCPTVVGGQYATGLPFLIGAFAGDPGVQTTNPPLVTARLLITALVQRAANSPVVYSSSA